MAVQAHYTDNANLYNRLILNKHFQENELQNIHNAVSDLTCVAPSSTKRCREPSMPEPLYIPTVNFPETSNDVRPIDPSTTASLIASQQLLAQLCQHNIEIDAIVRVHTECLRSELLQASKKHYQSLLSIQEQQSLKRLRAKEMELEAACRRNADLEEKLRQVAGEKEAWMGVAANGEAVVGRLRAAVEELMIVRGGAAVGGDNCTPVFGAEDALSACAGPCDGDRAAEAGRRRACRGCGEGDVSVLVLPCRHLCLCLRCESLVDTCPVCRSAKNASLQVFMA